MLSDRTPEDPAPSSHRESHPYSGEIEKNLSHWVQSYFADVETDVPKIGEHAKCGPKTIGNRVRSKSAVSSLMLEHAQKFFNSSPARALRADGRSLLEVHNTPSFILPSVPGAIAQPPGMSERKWTKALGEFLSVVRAVLPNCGKGILLGMRAALRVLLSVFVAAHKHVLICLRNIHRGIRVVANFPFAQSSSHFLADTRMQQSVVLASVLMIVFTISMPRITTQVSSRSTEAAPDKGQDPNTRAAAAVPIQAEIGSHYRVTDPTIGRELGNLSRFEIAPLERQAKYGDADAALLLAMAYETGDKLTQSCVKASQWVKVSAEAGNPAAEFNLGLRYLVGDGAPVNQAEGLMWLEKAAAQNYSEAKHRADIVHGRVSSLPHPKSLPPIVEDSQLLKNRHNTH